MQHAGAVARAAHTRVRNPHHVAHALREKLLRDRQLSPFGHAGRTLRSRILQDQHRVLRHRKIRIVDPCGEVVVIGEDDRRTRVSPQMRLGGGGLDHRAVRREVAAQHRKAVLGDERLVARQDHVGVEDLRAGDVLAQRLAVDGLRVEIEQVRD